MLGVAEARRSLFHFGMLIYHEHDLGLPREVRVSVARYIAEEDRLMRLVHKLRGPTGYLRFIGECESAKLRLMFTPDEIRELRMRHNRLLVAKHKDDVDRIFRAGLRELLAIWLYVPTLHATIAAGHDLSLLLAFGDESRIPAVRKLAASERLYLRCAQVQPERVQNVDGPAAK
jgi:hypothetical protein